MQWVSYVPLQHYLHMQTTKRGQIRTEKKIAQQHLYNIYDEHVLWGRKMRTDARALSFNSAFARFWALQLAVWAEGTSIERLCGRSSVFCPRGRSHA